MVTIITRPDWPSIVTAIGTVAVAVVAVGVALFAERRASKRLRARLAMRPHDLECVPVRDERSHKGHHGHGADR